MVKCLWKMCYFSCFLKVVMVCDRLAGGWHLIPPERSRESEHFGEWSFSDPSLWEVLYDYTCMSELVSCSSSGSPESQCQYLEFDSVHDC